MLLSVIFGWFIVVDFVFMFSKYKENYLMNTPAMRRLFSHLDSLSHQLCSSGPPLGQSVQAESASVTTSLS